MIYRTEKPSREDRDRLDAALNQILRYACENLANCWDIKIKMYGKADGHGSAYIDLIDPNGHSVSDNWDSDLMNIWDMVDHSRNPDP